MGAGAGAAAPPTLAAAARKGSWLVPPRATWREHAPWLLQFGGVGLAVEAVVGMSAAGTAAVAGGAARTARTRQTSSARPLPHPATTVACRPWFLLDEVPPTPGYHGVCLYRTPPTTSDTPHPSTWLNPTASGQKGKASFRGIWGEGVQPVDGGKGQNRVMGGGGGVGNGREARWDSAGGGVTCARTAAVTKRKEAGIRGTLYFQTPQPAIREQPAGGGGRCAATADHAGRGGATGGHRGPQSTGLPTPQSAWMAGAGAGGSAGGWSMASQRRTARRQSLHRGLQWGGAQWAGSADQCTATTDRVNTSGDEGGARTADSHSSAAHSTRSPPGPRWSLCGPPAVIENQRTATPVAVAGMRGLEEGSRGAWGMKGHQEAARRHRCRCRSQGRDGGAAGVGGCTHSQREGAPRRPLKLRQAEGS